MIEQTLQHGKPNSRPVSSAICTVNISGQLSNGDTVDVHENFKFQLGDLEVLFLKTIHIGSAKINQDLFLPSNHQFIPELCKSEAEFENILTILFLINFVN